MIEKYEKRCSVAFTGHRFISSGRVEEVRESVNNEIRLLYFKGFRNFFCGMALGFDMLAAEEVLKLKEELLDMSNELPMLLNKLELEKQTKEEEDKFTKVLSEYFLKSYLSTSL